MTGSLRSAVEQAVDLVPDLGPWWLVLALAPLLLGAVVLLTAGRWPSVPGHRAVQVLSLAAPTLSAAGAAGTAQSAKAASSMCSSAWGRLPQSSIFARPASHNLRPCEPCSSAWPMSLSAARKAMALKPPPSSPA